uniref:Putative secreted protein n=1 Tax=Anopheles darlingi TaxID=43151 RepID=A0A2M4DM79_ANODA
MPFMPLCQGHAVTRDGLLAGFCILWLSGRCASSFLATEPGEGLLHEVISITCNLDGWIPFIKVTLKCYKSSVLLVFIKAH